VGLTLLAAACGSHALRVAPDAAVIDAPAEPVGIADAALGPCGAVPVTFRLRPSVAEGNLWARNVTSVCWQGDNWLRIYDAAGTLLDLIHPCAVDCDSCTGLVCSLTCTIDGVLTADGVTSTWDGTVFAAATCGPDGRACTAPACTPLGTYMANVCALSASGSGQETCDSVTFDLSRAPAQAFFDVIIHVYGPP